MGIRETLEAGQSAVAPRNRVEILLDALSEIEKIELEEILFDKRWGHAAITKAIPEAYKDYPEAHQLKLTSVREWRVKKGIV